MALQTCPSCHRHVRPRERACPFCETRLSSIVAPLPAILGLAAGLCVVGCDDDKDSDTTAAPMTTQGSTGAGSGDSGSGESAGTTGGSGGATTNDNTDLDAGGEDYAGPPDPEDRPR